MSTSIRRFTGAAALVLAVAAAFPIAANASEGNDAPRTSAAEAKSEGTAKGKLVDGVAPEFTTAEFKEKAKEKSAGPKAAWGYQIMPSCAGAEALIRQGANFWQGATETPGSGKPVECTNDYIADCFGTANAVGCNYGPGQKMLLSTKVSDFALLAAHEFGHEWHPHSAAGCMNWASAYEVMRPTFC
jgi:hypothetical protein